MAAEPLPTQVVKCILQSRLPADAQQQRTIERTVSNMPLNSAVQLRVSLGHAECQAKCSRAQPVEVWTIAVEEEKAGEGDGQSQLPLPGHFLLNALRSHVHFSQLSAWLACMQEAQRNAIAASYDLIPNNATTAPLTQPIDGTVASRSLPLAVWSGAASPCGARTLVRVTVTYVQRETALTPAGVCLQLGPLPTDEWLLPSPLPSPTRNADSDDDGASATVTLESSTFAVALASIRTKPLPELLYSPNGPSHKAAHMESGLAPVDQRQLYEEGKRKGHQEALQRTPSQLQHQHQQQLTKREEQVRKRGVQGGQGTAVRRLNLVEMKRGAGTIVVGCNKKVAPSSSSSTCLLRSRLLGSFEECALRGLLHGTAVKGYTAQIAAAGLDMVCSPVTVQLDTVALEEARASVARGAIASAAATVGRVHRRGYRIPAKGHVQMTLMNPDGGAVKVFLVPFDVSKLAPGSATFIRHRMCLMAHENGPSITTSSPSGNKESFHDTKYLLHLSLRSDRSGRIFLHGEVKILFSTDFTNEALNIKMVNGRAQSSSEYQLRAFTHQPEQAPHSCKS